MGFFDLHLHILPGVDDGAGDLDEALDMAGALVDCGFEGAAVSPHLDSRMFPNDPEHLREEAGRLAEALAEKRIDLRLLPGAEHFLDAEGLSMLLGGRGIPVGGTGGVYLVEISMQHPVATLEQQVFRLRLKGITPIFAHPERCKSFEDPEMVRRVVEGGALLQLDLGSLAGDFGRRPRLIAERLLQEGAYALAATDLHDADQAAKSLPGWIRRLERAAGTEGLEILLSENPKRLLSGRPCLAVGERP
ncbi:MAG: tyrosine-protein phosphatase [Myxococcota bacterium]